MDSPPPDIYVLLMEGTNLGSDKPCVTESVLKTRFEALFRETEGRLFVAWSAQNIDRTVTLYKACRKTSRTLVVDLYTAEVLEMLGEFGRLPHHRLTFEGAMLAVGKPAEALADYFDACRRKRNEIDYTGAAIATGPRQTNWCCTPNPFSTLSSVFAQR